MRLILTVKCKQEVQLHNYWFCSNLILLSKIFITCYEFSIYSTDYLVSLSLSLPDVIMLAFRSWHLHLTIPSHHERMPCLVNWTAFSSEAVLISFRFECTCPAQARLSCPARTRATHRIWCNRLHEFNNGSRQISGWTIAKYLCTATQFKTILVT